MEKRRHPVNENTCGILPLMKTTGMSRKEILAHIERGCIQAVKKGRLYVFTEGEKKRLERLNATYTGVWCMLRGMLHEKSVFSLNKRTCRDELLEFIENNDWFGIKALKAQEVYFAAIDGEKYFIRKTDAERIRNRIALWLDSYGKDDHEKVELLLKRLEDIYPETGKWLSVFAKSSDVNDAAIWKLTDYLCNMLQCELTESSEDELERLAVSMDKSLPLSSARMFTEYLMFLRKNSNMKNGWTYHFGARGESASTDAYPATDFLRMAYIVFNEEAWEKECLLEKALSSEKYANLWLFVSLHFICGWRGTDIVRLPLPRLPFQGGKVRQLLAEDLFDASVVIDEFELRLRYVPMRPGKTEAYKDVPELKLFIPESLRKPMGKILSSAASWHEDASPGGIFIRKAGNIFETEEFFGTDFITACGSKGFSSRRANKAYLQGIELTAGNTPGKPKGYMLAALARSHKGGFGKLPETTDIYLRDAKFSGYSPEFIAKEMFERGVFSFIPALMMEIYAHELYTKLPVTAQTSLIMDIGVAASGLEGMAKTVEASIVKARNAIAQIMKHPKDIRGTTADILQNIASGNAPGKQEGCLCLMTASGFACMDPGRSCCIGCGYEIYTKTIMRCLTAEYKRLVKRKKDANEAETMRCSKILKDAVMPAIAEMIVSMKQLYPDSDISPLLEEMKGGLQLC